MVRRSIRRSITRIDCATVLAVSCTCHSTPPSELLSASTAANSLIPRTCMRICGLDEKSVRSSRPVLTNRVVAHSLVEKLNTREHTVHHRVHLSLFHLPLLFFLDAFLYSRPFYQFRPSIYTYVCFFQTRGCPIDQNLFLT